MELPTFKSLFYKPFKIKHNPEDILVWGCPHYGHNPNWEIPLWETRGYNSSESHDEGIINNWNKKASVNTVGILLGDNSFGKYAEENFIHLLNALKYNVLFVLFGNHTSGAKQVFERCEENILKVGDKTVVFCPNYIEVIINGKSVVMSHYPVLSFNGQAGGSYMLFSHVHGNLEKSAVGKAYLESGVRALEMSVEKWPIPPNFKEISDILNKRQKVSFDHHSSSTANPF